MPVIVYKTMQVTAIYAQIRHITCEWCAQAYTYLAVGTHTSQTVGLPVVSSDEGMREEVGRHLSRALEGVGKRPRLGRGMCPHCQRYQGWMVRDSFHSLLPRGLFVGALVGGIASIGLAIAYMMWSTYAMGVSNAALLGVFLGCAGGFGWAWMKSLSHAPYVGMYDSRAMKPTDFTAFVAECKQREFEPSLAWYSMSGGSFDPNYPVAPLPEVDLRSA
jgi:hypothetical protein